MSNKEYKNSKSDRLLYIFFKAMKGEPLSVKELANDNNVSTRTITRDINDIKAFLSNYRDIIGNVDLKYSTTNHCYRLEINDEIEKMQSLH